MNPDTLKQLLSIVYLETPVSSSALLNSIKEAYYEILSPEEQSRLKSMPYKEFLQTWYWKAIREYKLQTSGRMCALCSSSTNLQVHHRNYSIRGEEHRFLSDLTVLCQECHSRHHGKGVRNG